MAGETPQFWNIFLRFQVWGGAALNVSLGSYAPERIVVIADAMSIHDEYKALQIPKSD